MKFEIYLASWNSDYLNALQACPITKQTVINIAFGSFNFNAQDTINGITTITDDQIKFIISYARNKGAKVKLALGGGTSPYFLSKSNLWNDIDNMSKAITRILIKYTLDGCDLDIEEPNKDGLQQKAFSLIKSLRALNPDKILTLTVPGQGWNSYWKPLSIEAYSYLDYINFMEYYITVSPNITFDEQIKADIKDYYINQWNIPSNKICLGIMPGKSSAENILTLDMANSLSLWAANESLAGVMLWDMNRDYSGIDKQPSFSYINAVLKNINK